MKKNRGLRAAAESGHQLDMVKFCMFHAIVSFRGLEAYWHFSCKRGKEVARHDLTLQ